MFLAFTFLFSSSTISDTHLCFLSTTFFSALLISVVQYLRLCIFASEHPIQSLLQLEDSVRQVLKEELGLNTVLTSLESGRRRRLRNEQFDDGFKGVFEDVEAE
ncbi:hypothetical protein PIB30_059779 [Stylosanthes scabra]|uniref:Uncharacterized protein n=1 Tax=Stylosanthes scabra TaxID=79078 RepID=A0ABU6SLD9_9FABA|nr:hypothetical protein [Stylosanthes scabra]